MVGAHPRVRPGLERVQVGQETVVTAHPRVRPGLRVHRADTRVCPYMRIRRIADLFYELPSNRPSCDRNRDYLQNRPTRRMI